MKNDLRTLGHLVRRGLKIFLSDKMSVFLSLLAPIIILFLYVMFLGDLQSDSLEARLQGVEISARVLRGFVDGWMLAGALSVACITVSYCAQTVMVGDREDGIIADMLTSPVKRGVLSLSYLICNFVITLVICAIVMIIALIYIAIAGWYLSFVDVLKLIGILLLSVGDAALFTTFVASFVRTKSAHGAMSGILSAAIGFFIGAYMPISMFPKAIRYMVLFIPGTYSAGVFRNVFMRGALAKISAVAPPAEEGLREYFCMYIDGFGNKIEEWQMWIIFLATLVLFAALYFIVTALRTKRNTLFAPASERRKKVKK